MIHQPVSQHFLPHKITQQVFFSCLRFHVKLQPAIKSPHTDNDIILCVFTDLHWYILLLKFIIKIQLCLIEQSQQNADVSTHNLHNLSAWRVQTEDKIKFQTDAEKKCEITYCVVYKAMGHSCQVVQQTQSLDPLFITDFSVRTAHTVTLAHRQCCFIMTFVNHHSFSGIWSFCLSREPLTT